MEMPQENSLFSYLYLKQAKISCFFFYLLSFFFYKIRGMQNRSCWGVVSVAEERWWGKVVRE
jgi:hypothetical protein